MKKNIILYGFEGTDKQYRVKSYYAVDADIASIDYIKYRSSVMMDMYPSITEVYAIDNRPALRTDYIEAVNATTLERTYEFYDLIKRSGLRVF